MADRQNYSNGPAGYYGGDNNTYDGPVYNPNDSEYYNGGSMNQSQNGAYYRPAGQNTGSKRVPSGSGYAAGTTGNSRPGQQNTAGGYPTGNGYTAGNPSDAAYRQQYPAGNGYSNGNSYPAGYQPARQRSNGPSMAARAAGKANTELYGRRQQQRSGQQRQVQQQRARQQQAYRQQPVRAAAEDYDDYDDEPRQRPKRRKRHHPLRNLLIILLVLAAIAGCSYFLLFRAPEQAEADGYTRKAGFYNILLCATDEDGERTDSMMILSLDKKGKSVSLTSLPRDTLLKNGDKLNSIYINAGCGESGAEALMDTVEELLGFRPDGYAVISYQVFKDAVDAMGGVKFDVPMDMTVDYANNDDDDVFIPAGEQVLDGDTALRVVRYRYGYSMADIQRVYVQQSFLKAMIKQCMSPSKWLRLPAVYSAVMENTITDLSGAQLRYIALWAMLSYGDGINQNTLPGEGVTYNGASCYALYSYNVVDMVNSYMDPYEEAITWDDVSIYSVSNGELVPDQTSGTAFDASTYDYQ